MKPPEDRSSNAMKRFVDRLASELLVLDLAPLMRGAELVANHIDASGKARRVIVCGGAGSNKTTFSKHLARVMSLPAFDLDEYIPGGWTPDGEEYARRLHRGLYNLMEDLPQEWVVEHVRAASEKVTDLIAPRWAILLNPGVSHLKLVAEARDHAGDNSDGERARRALESAIQAKASFDALPGKVVLDGKGWALKNLKP